MTTILPTPWELTTGKLERRRIILRPTREKKPRSGLFRNASRPGDGTGRTDARTHAQTFLLSLFRSVKYVKWITMYLQVFGFKSKIFFQRKTPTKQCHHHNKQESISPVSVHLSLNYDVTSSIIIIYNEAFFLTTHHSCCCWAISRMDSSSGDFECHNK